MQLEHSPAACVFEVKTRACVTFMFETKKSTVTYSHGHCSLWQREKKEKKSHACFKWASQVAFKIKYKMPFKYNANGEKIRLYLFIFLKLRNIDKLSQQD